MAPTAPSNNILGETVISLAQAAGRLPGTRANQRIHPSTILRWIVRGTRTPGGRLVRLAGCRCGYRWVTSAEALERYTAELTDASTPDTSAPPAPRSPAKRVRDAANVDAKLEKLLA